MDFASETLRWACSGLSPVKAHASPTDPDVYPAEPWKGAQGGSVDFDFWASCAKSIGSLLAH
jgi:hypothetical protein